MERKQILAALKRLRNAVHALAETDSNGKYYFEENVATNQECFLRWIELNNAQADANTALGL